jgi:hypothetical protein
MALELAGHAGDGVGNEGRSPGWVVAVHSQDQPDAGRLAQVLQRDLLVVAVPGGQPVGQAEVGQDDPLPELGVAGLGVAAAPALDLVGGRPVLGPDPGGGQLVQAAGGGRGMAEGHRGGGHGPVPTGRPAAGHSATNGRSATSRRRADSEPSYGQPASLPSTARTTGASSRLRRS